MKGKNEYNYYDEFIKLSEYSLMSAKFLHDTLGDFSSKGITSKIAEIHHIEYRADQAKHEIMKRLAKEFLPPIERQDIYNLSEGIDNVTDSIEDVLVSFDMFNIQSISATVLKFTKLIVKCCTSMNEALKEFKNFKTSKVLHDKLIEINYIEETGNTLYVDLVRNLYRSHHDPIHIICWYEILHRLEQCCNNCEYVADILESIIINNT